MNYIDLVKDQFNAAVELRERRPGVFQLLAPLYHEDGDMVDIFLEPANGEDKRIRICDHAMTLMRLSYSYDIDTSNKERIFNRILSENGVSEDNGNLYIDAAPNSLYPAIMQFAQTVAKVSGMELFKREAIRSLFYEMLAVFVEESLSKFNPKHKLLPIPQRDDLEVDIAFPLEPKPVYLFGVRDSAKARLATIACLEFQKPRLPFRSCIVHEDFEALNRKDRIRITSAADKQFPSLDDFMENAEQFLEREIA